MEEFLLEESKWITKGYRGMDEDGWDTVTQAGAPKESQILWGGFP